MSRPYLGLYFGKWRQRGGSKGEGVVSPLGERYKLLQWGLRPVVTEIDLGTFTTL